MKYVANVQGMPDAISKNFRDIERAMKQIVGGVSIRTGEQQPPSPVTIPIFDKKASSITVDPITGLIATSVQEALEEESAARISADDLLAAEIAEVESAVVDQQDTGICHWDSPSTAKHNANSNGFIPNRTFTLLQGGHGRIYSKKIPFATQSIDLPLTYGIKFINVGVDGLLYLSDTYPDASVGFPLFQGFTGVSGTYYIGREDHPYNFDTQVSRYLHAAAGTVITGDGANIQAAATLGQVSVQGASSLEDHGLTTVIPDSAGVGVVWIQDCKNTLGQWGANAFSATLQPVWCYGSVVTPIGANKYAVYRLYVAKDDGNLPTSMPRYIALMGTTEYPSLSGVTAAIEADQGAPRADGALATAELCQLGLVAIKSTGEIVYVKVAKTQLATVNTTAGGFKAVAYSGLASDVEVIPFGSIVAVNVQTALQELDTEKQPLIAAGTTLQYWRGDKTWQALNTAAVVESTNLYFTNARAQSAITGGASSIVTSNLTASRALASDASGKVAVATATLAEINFLNGLLSNAQAQFNAKAPLASPAFTGTVTGITAAMVGLGNVTNYAQVKRTEMGVANGVATLDANGVVLTSQLPSYVDDIIEANTFSALPVTGSTGKVYVTLDTNLTYRWSGTAYVEISASLALGETSSTAYRGDRGAIAYAHSQTTGNPHGTTKADLGLGAVENTALSTWAGSANITTVGNAAVLNKALTGYVVGENSALVATDTVLAAMQKIQGQINARPVAGNTGITTLGTVATGTWNATAISAAKGGTGQTGYTVGDLLYASSATALSKLADVAVGNVLRSGGVGVAPAWGKVALTDHAPATVNRVLKSVAGGFADSNISDDGSNVSLGNQASVTQIYIGTALDRILNRTTSATSTGFGASAITTDSLATLSTGEIRPVHRYRANSDNAWDLTIGAYGAGTAIDWYAFMGNVASTFRIGNSGANMLSVSSAASSFDTAQFALPQQVKTSSFTLPTNAPIGTMYYIPHYAVASVTITAPAGESIALLNSNSTGSSTSNYWSYRGFWVVKSTSTLWST